MTDIIAEFLANLLSDAFSQLDSVLASLLRSMLYVEDLFSGALSADAISNVYQFLYGFCCVLVILKFLFKGFRIYILWRDGDADSSPQDMVIGTIEAVAMMVGFPYLYGVLADVVVWLSDGIMERFALSGVSLGAVTFNLAGTGLFTIVVFLVYAVLLAVLGIKLIQRGVELLVLRLGVPFACLGLIDSDMGIFKSYVQTLFKTMFTSIVQIALLSLSIRVIANVSLLNCICGIAIIVTAFHTPGLMQQFMVPAGGSVTNKIYSGARAVQTIKGLIGK